MSSRLPTLVTHLAAAFAVALTGVAYAIGGVEAATGAAFGGALGVSNWAVTRWVGSRVVDGAVKNRAPLMLLLILKMGASMFLCYALIVLWGIHPGGLAIGLGALVAAALVGSAATLTKSPAISEET